MSNGVVIGQTWDGPVISLKKSGKPISYQAPKEGAIGWVDGWALSKASRMSIRPMPSSTTSIRPKARRKSPKAPATILQAIGADKLLSDKARGIFSEAYPGPSIDKMWWRPVEPSWFGELRTQYAEKYKAA